eukprot:Skav226372  [mRNA]  locus=scaffold290:201957:203150:+ [translate_table: standard]
MEDINATGSGEYQTQTSPGTGPSSIPSNGTTWFTPTSPSFAFIIAADGHLGQGVILYRLLVKYQPGGAGEKSQLLSHLTTMEEAKDMGELAASLRTWRRHFKRALEIGAVIPDGTLLLAALESAIQMIATKGSQASFRVSQSRAELAVDANPTQDRVWRYSECLLAEADSLTLLGASGTMVLATTPPATPAKVRQLDTPTTFHGSRDRGDIYTFEDQAYPPTETPCRWFRSDQGCRAGRQCRFSHSWEGITDKADRCWVCGSKEHRKMECKVRGTTSTTTSRPGDPGAGSGGGRGGGGTGRGRGNENGSNGSKDGNNKTGKGHEKHAGSGGASTGSSTTTTTTTPTPNTTYRTQEAQPKVNGMSTDTTEKGGDSGASGGGNGKPGAGDLLMEAIPTF